MGKITFDEIRDMLSGVQSYSSGYISAVCPFHDDAKPSLMVYPDGWFRCLACGVSGNLEKLHRKLVGWDASRVVREKTDWRAPFLPTDLPELRVVAEESHSSLLKFEQFQWYLKNRGVEGRIEPCRLGWMNSWYTIPIYSRERQLQGLVLRASSSIQQATGQRFIQPHGQKPMMYCPDWYLFDHCDTLAIVFGMFDALALSELRYPVVTPTGGKDSFDPAWLDDFRKKIIVFPDKGEEQTAIRLAGKLGWRGEVAEFDYPDGVKDPDGFLEQGKREQLEVILASHLGR